MQAALSQNFRLFLVGFIPDLLGFCSGAYNWVRLVRARSVASRDVMRTPFVQLILVKLSRLDWMLRERDVPISVKSTTRNTRKATKNLHK